MKKFLLGFLTMFVITISSFGTVSVPNANKIENRSDLAKFELNLGDVTNMSEKEINFKINSFFEKTVNPVTSKELNCTVKVTGTINAGVGKVEISVEVTGPCSEIAKSGKMIAKMVLDQVKNALK